MATNASAVSRALHGAGFTCHGDYKREGVRVKRSALGVMVTADLNGYESRCEMGAKLYVALVGLYGEPAIRRSESHPWMMWVET